MTPLLSMPKIWLVFSPRVMYTHPPASYIRAPSRGENAVSLKPDMFTQLSTSGRNISFRFMCLYNKSGGCFYVSILLYT